MRISIHRTVASLSCLLAVVAAPLGLQGAETGAASLPSPAPTPAAQRTLAPGPFKPDWDSLAANYIAPEWFRDAKFGIWAHWSAQCVPEQGDWYARHMYVQGSRQNVYHEKHYGHPSEFGFMELDNLWKAENWDPESLITLYEKAGAKYFVALANHHDNFDAYDSKYHDWNSVKVGPKKDIVGTWAKVARAHGLRFGVSNHSAHAWHWFQTAYGYDGEGAKAGVRYDAARLTKAEGKGKWWEGLDPAELYTGPNMVIPDAIQGVKAVNEWHEKNDRKWDENPPAMNQAFTDKWFLRCQDLVDKYQPDLVYFDNTGLPLGQAGLDIAAHYYNANISAHQGRNEAVLNSKGIPQGPRKGALVEDIERGVAEGIRALPWQTDTCIGAWHYERSLYENHKYKTVAQVVRMLADIVSKNGNLLLSVPLRGDGTIDADEEAFLEGMGRWLKVNGEAIYGTRPWTVYGEGPSTEEKAEAGHFGGAKDVRSKPYTSEDLRFTTKGGHVYAIVMALPTKDAARVAGAASDAQELCIKNLATKAATEPGTRVATVSLLGGESSLVWKQDEAGLHVSMPALAPCEHAVVLKIAFVKP